MRAERAGPLAARRGAVLAGARASNTRRMLNTAMVRLGWALDFRRYSKGAFAVE